MHLYKTTSGTIVQVGDLFYHSGDWEWDAFIDRPMLHQRVLKDIEGLDPAATSPGRLLAPIGTQEIWAAGVTYLRSREARMEESKQAGGGDFYAKVYEAERPELFFKATASRTVGPGGPIRIRKDSGWNVPEPELTLFASSSGSIEGYTIGNDVSSRDIEGENPLYLPQAKCYDGSAALGPGLYVPGTSLPPETAIRLAISRAGAPVFSGEITISRIKRRLEELVDYLFRETTFPTGVFLMTGTGIVPPDHFTLLPGDEVSISIDGIGTLTNPVAG